jgi:hypothetical protein
VRRDINRHGSAAGSVTDPLSGGEAVIPPVNQPADERQVDYMGDKSPKAVHKQSSQKQARTDKLRDQKQQAVFAKQSGNKK